MRVAVIGSGGFVGSAVIATLRAAGVETLAIDRCAPPAGGVADSLVADVTTAEGLQKVTDAVDGATGVVWLAAAIRHRSGVDETAAEDLSVMVEAPLRLVQTARRQPAAFVYVSSIQVYGRPRALPVGEDHPTDPVTAYGVAKLLGEQMLGIACKRRGTALSALRLAFVYGPGQHEKNVLPRFIDAVRRGEAPVIHGAGRDIRDDVYVGDVARAVHLALTARAEGAFNIASGRPHTIADVAAAVCRLGPPGLAPRHDEQPSSWVDRSFAIDRARDAFGFEATTPFEAGVRAMWEAGP